MSVLRRHKGIRDVYKEPAVRLPGVIAVDCKFGLRNSYSRESERWLIEHIPDEAMIACLKHFEQA